MPNHHGLPRLFDEFATGNRKPFKVVMARVNNAGQAEKQVHKKLAPYRENKGAEFFNPPERLEKVLSELAIEITGRNNQTLITPMGVIILFAVSMVLIILKRVMHNSTNNLAPIIRNIGMPNAHAISPITAKLPR